MAPAVVRESVTVAGRAERARVARAFTAGVLGPGHPCGDDAALLVSELFGNSVRHSGSGGHDTVFGFNHAGGDAISFGGENAASVSHVVATAQEHNGNTLVTLPDGSTITLVGVTHIDSSFFH